MILEGAKNYADNSALLHKNFIVDNCKTLFFVGHDTTTLATSWALMLLAAHPDWQARARAEVLEICRDKPLDTDMLRSMKVLKIVIHEVLRLYSLGPLTARDAFETITLKNIVISKGCVLQIPIAYLHQNPDIWGPNAHKFNPEIFFQWKACQPLQAHMPFGMGANICDGQHLAMTELKVILALSLSFASPSHPHISTPLCITWPLHLNMVFFSM
ncbi:hypothetical protein C1H46_016203 [Malus baccata]|uniref:Cytochrome P450 n=1 Tax=Malus baccata TaxID=106549 RepID=A0A540MHJ2_MALBA|nr:hypothetical protein C1H46_016203 [Malus baccata]